ncbi:MAG TPA: hypothetical protein VKT80_18765, partial [Chloroflexota bacterium]|nr:hypothetical protein [Chloroflexota bacterium]
YSAGDAPTLYYNYLLQTEGVSSLTNMVDAFRVYGSTDGGVTWSELTTNNDILSTNVQSAELPTYLTASAVGNTSDPTALSTVQPTYPTNSWRQARVDLSEFAGQSNIQLRFDFSTAGTSVTESGSGLTTQGLQGDQFGVGPNDIRTAQNNKFLGAFLDDIIVGFANRGEMVTAAPAGETSFFNMPQNPNTGAPKQALVGAYQLEIRAGQNYGTTITGTSADITINQQFDDNQRMISGITINARPGFLIGDGQTFAISDGVNTLTFEFDSNGVLNNANDQRVSFTSGDSDFTVAQSIRDSINAAAAAKKFKVTAEISDGTITGSNSTDPNVDLINAVSVTGNVLFTSYDFHGDQDTPQPQGRVEILNNSITNVSQYGIKVVPGPRDAGSNQPHPGSLINLPSLDTSRFVPGPDIVSNVVSNFGVGGILFSGDTAAGPL